MKRTFVSAVTAACLTLGTASAINVASGLVAPTTAHASVLGKIKASAKSFGGAVKAAGSLGKTIGVGTARNAVQVGKQIAKTPVGDAARAVGRGVEQTYRRF